MHNYWVQCEVLIFAYTVKRCKLINMTVTSPWWPQLKIMPQFKCSSRSLIFSPSCQWRIWDPSNIECQGTKVHICDSPGNMGTQKLSNCRRQCCPDFYLHMSHLRNVKLVKNAGSASASLGQRWSVYISNSQGLPRLLSFRPQISEWQGCTARAQLQRELDTRQDGVKYSVSGKLDCGDFS